MFETTRTYASRSAVVLCALLVGLAALFASAQDYGSYYDCWGFMSQVDPCSQDSDNDGIFDEWDPCPYDPSQFCGLGFWQRILYGITHPGEAFEAISTWIRNHCEWGWQPHAAPPPPSGPPSGAPPPPGGVNLGFFRCAW